MEAQVQDEDLEDDEDADRDEAEETDLGENGLQVTGRVVVGADERGGTTEEGVGTGGDNDTLGLTLLADRRREALVADLLALRERLAGETGLVDRDVDGIVETAVGGDDVTDLERDDITGDEVGRLDFDPRAVTLALGLGGERLHERLDGVSGRALLVETDGRVDEQEKDDTDKVLPVGRAALTVGQGDGDKRGALHDPRKRVPHEAVEFASGSVSTAWGRREIENAREELEDSRSLLGLELVGTEDFPTAVGLGVGEAVLLAPVVMSVFVSTLCADSEVCVVRVREKPR